jgi:ribonuclease E
MNVTLPRDVAMYLLNQKRDDLATLERRYSARIQIILSDKLMPHQSEIETRTREVTAPIAVVRPGEVAPAERMAPANGAPTRTSTRRPTAAGVSYARGPVPAAREGEDADAAGQGRRRRGGRGRRSDGGEATNVSAASPAPEVESSFATPVGETEPHDAVGIPGPVDAESVPELAATAASEPRLEVTTPVPSEAVVTAPSAVSDGHWIENISPFVPVDGVASAEAGAALSDPARRRRRRGGRRGGRGRRTTGHEDSLSPVSNDPMAGSSEDRESAVPSPDSPAPGGPRSPARRRRRRGGSGRRRPAHEGRASSEGGEATSAVAVSAPAEPPVE